MMNPSIGLIMGTIKKESSIKAIISLLFINICILNLNAQKTALDSLQVLQDSRALDIYTLTNNAAYTGFLRPSVGYAQANAISTFGRYKQPMQATKNAQLSMASGGFKKINNWGYNGYFSYKKIFEDKVSWSGVYNAYDDNPFIWADSSTGNWQKDEVMALIGITAPTIAKKINTGLQIVYNMASGARLSEPKPFFRYRKIAIQPGLSYQLPNQQELGFTGTIGFVKEENELGLNNNSGSNVLLYRFRGYGTFSKSPFVSGERRREQTDFGVNIHYKKSWRAYHLLFALNAAQRDDEIFEGVSQPVTTGYFTGIELGGLISLYEGNSNIGKSITIKTSSKNGYTDDMIFRAESASSVYQKIAINISKWRLNTMTKNLWQFNLSPVFTFIDNTDQATLTQFTTSSLETVGSINYRNKSSNKLQINAGIDAGYNYIVDDYFSSSRPNLITTLLVQPNYSFYTTNYIIVNAKIGMDIAQSKKSIIHSVNLGTNNMLTKLKSNSRSTIQLTYSIIF